MYRGNQKYFSQRQKANASDQMQAYPYANDMSLAFYGQTFPFHRQALPSEQ